MLATLTSIAKYHLFSVCYISIRRCSDLRDFSLGKVPRALLAENGFAYDDEKCLHYRSLMTLKIFQKRRQARDEPPEPDLIYKE